jgi:RNA polymerase sigma factor (sigma-70 family)
MSQTEPQTPVQACLDRLAAGDQAARGDLIRLARDRVLVMTRAMLNRYPGVRRWEETDDVVQNVLIRLDHALTQLRLESTRDFLAIAATNIRREVIDLARHYYGPLGHGAHHATPPVGAEGVPELEGVAGRGGGDPAVLAEWTELHDRIANLPAAEREVFDLHWYHGLSQEEAAVVLGVSVKTVRRRWVAGKFRLSQLLGRDPSISVETETG